jgi:hypothetical protein
MSRVRRRVFQCEPLEGRQLLSTAHAVAAPARPAAAVAHGKPLALDDVMAASAYAVKNDNGSSEDAVISLAGQAGSMGQVTGTLTEGIDETIETIARANLVLKNSRGTVTLTLSRFDVLQNLTRAYNSGFVAKYVVTSGTGAFAGATGSGTIQVTPDIGDFDMHVTLHSTA